jgi:hypothetical protein
MGSKYKFVPKEGPPPGYYENSSNVIKSKIPAAHIRTETSPYRRPEEITPDPGTYDGHLKTFGDGLKNIDMGNKYKFVPKEGPPPGLYENSSDAIKPKVFAAHIREETSPYRRPEEITPDPG